MELPIDPKLVDEWFVQEVEKGIAAADRGEFVDHEDIRKLIERRHPAEPHS
jgi:predicted transcriptional regulator